MTRPGYCVIGVLLVGGGALLASATPRNEVISESEFNETYLYFGMPEAELQALFNRGDLPLHANRRKNGEYDLTLAGRRCFRIGFYRGRLASIEYRQQKGWLVYWSFTRAPLVKLSRFQSRLGNIDPKDLMQRINGILLDLAYVPRDSKWLWFEHLAEYERAYGSPEGYYRTFDPQTDAPDPVLEIGVVPDFPSEGVLELRVSLGLHELRADGVVDPYPRSLDFVRVDDYPAPVPDFVQLDAFAARFSSLVDRLITALKAQLGTAVIEQQL